MKLLVSLFALLSLTALVGCKLKIPAFDSARVEVHAGGRVTTTGVLSPAQTKAVREWLEARKTGWDHRIESTGPVLLVKLERGGQLVGVMNVMENQVKVGDFFRPITPEERQMLHLHLATFLNSKQKT